MESHEQKISHLKALYHLACADRWLTEVEIAYIRTVARHLGVDQSELENFDGSEPELVLPDKEYKIYALFHRLVLILMVDNTVNETEQRYCFNLGVKMGLHPNAITEIIAHATRHGAMGTQPKDVMDIFRKYLS